MRHPVLAAILLLGLSSCQEAETEKDYDEELTDIVRTGSGPIQGKKYTKDGKEQFEFLGIPYAEPPVGKLRFKPPVPVSPWTKVYEAFSDGATCMQQASPFEEEALTDEGRDEDHAGFADLFENISEDCLTLNVFTNSMGSFDKAPQAVMVWIHGGGFTLGSKDIYRMDNLVQEDVVLVAMNYRLGALGFLSFGNDLVSGNMGLRDQHLAIQWVRANIHLFGGDPDKITIFGESAGGMSVQAQVLSPHNEGLLGGAIAQSGSILFVSVATPGQEVEYAENAAAALGCPTTMDQRTLDCLQNLDAERLNEPITDPEESVFNASLPPKYTFMPVVDSYATNPFLPVDPLEALVTGKFNKVPYMSGIVKFEGALFTGGLATLNITGADTLALISSPFYLPFVLHYGQQGKTFGNVALNFYNHPTGDSRLEQEMPTIDFFTDASFTSSDQKSVELMSVHTRHVYNYYLTQHTPNSIVGSLFNLTDEYTPMHGDDFALMLLHGSGVLTEGESATAGHMLRYWANFAKYGTPSPVFGEGAGQQPVWFPVGQEKVDVDILNVLNSLNMLIQDLNMLCLELHGAKGNP